MGSSVPPTAARRQVTAYLCLAWTLLLSLPVIANAQKSLDASQHPTLRGVTGVSVAVERIWEDAATLGLTEADIRADAERALRVLGIRSLNGQEAATIRGGAYLHIVVHTHIAESVKDVSVYDIRVAVVQKVRLVRDAAVSFYSETWSARSRLGVIDRGFLADRVREDVRHMVREFSDAYLAANQRQREN